MTILFGKPIIHLTRLGPPRPSVTLVQSNLKPLLKLFGGRFNTLLLGLILCVGVNFFAPLTVSVPFYVLTWVGTCFGFLPTLTLGLLSKKSPKAVQGSLMGLHESLVNLGGVIGPIYSSTTTQMSHVIPFWTTAAGLLSSAIWALAIPALKEPDVDNTDKKSE